MKIDCLLVVRQALSPVGNHLLNKESINGYSSVYVRDGH